MRNFKFIYLISNPILFEFERKLCNGSVKNIRLFESVYVSKRRVSGRSHALGLKAPKPSNRFPNGRTIIIGKLECRGNSRAVFVRFEIPASGGFQPK